MRVLRDQAGFPPRPVLPAQRHASQDVSPAVGADSLWFPKHDTIPRRQSALCSETSGVHRPPTAELEAPRGPSRQRDLVSTINRHHLCRQGAQRLWRCKELRPWAAPQDSGTGCEEAWSEARGQMLRSEWLLEDYDPKATEGSGNDKGPPRERLPQPPAPASTCTPAICWAFVTMHKGTDNPWILSGSLQSAMCVTLQNHAPQNHKLSPQTVARGSVW